MVKKKDDKLTSDGIETGAWSTEEISSAGIEMSGPDNFSYSFADLDEDFAHASSGSYTVDGIVDPLSVDFEDKELRKKYPALQDAWEHYRNVKHMCEQKEKENED